MNLYDTPEPSDQVYKTYLSIFKTTIKIINESTQSSIIDQYMNDVVKKFTYFHHTNPKIMAISRYMAGNISTPFTPEIAYRYIEIAFKGEKNLERLIFDVARYYHHLITP